MRYYRAYIDGIDKTGKDLICTYVSELSNHKYLVKPRGIISMMAYSKIYNREYVYDLEKEKDVLNVLLTVNYEDWKVRCKLNKEKDVTNDDYDYHSSTFKSYYDLLKHHDFPTLIYNTSELTPYNIAKDIVKHLDMMNGELYA